MKDYSKHVLFVGPHFKLRGGMASVLGIYSNNIEGFNFLSTYGHKNPLVSIFYFIGSLFKFAGILISNRDIRIIHIHTACRGSFKRKSIIVLLSKLFGKKTILHIHGGEFKEYYKNSGILKPYILFILNISDELAVLSGEWKVYFDELTKKQKSIVVNNPVEMPGKVAKNILEIPINVLYLNHVTEKKGIFDVVELFKKNKAAFKGVFKLNIAGAGNEVEKLKQLIVENGLEEIIEYKGWVSGKPKDDLLKNCNLFILTSYFEGLPMSILEALALGKPVISSNVGGIPQIVRPGENGWLVKPGDMAALEKIFLQIKSDPHMLETYGEHSLNVVKEYSAENVVASLNEIYEELLTGKPIKQQATV